MGVKLEKPEDYDGGKCHEVDTCLFWVREHLNLMNVPARTHVAYAASLLKGNATTCWEKLYEGDQRLNIWEEFRDAVIEQFKAENFEMEGHR